MRSETAAKFMERLEKNQDKLFTFLNYDGVPWNNNNAEHAVMAFAVLQSKIEGVTTEKGLRDYLVLLSICQTCKYNVVDFLSFLRSARRTFTRSPKAKGPVGLKRAMQLPELQTTLAGLELD